MMALAKCASNDLSVLVLEYPEIIIPEQGLKKLNSGYFLAPTGALEEGISCVRASVRPFLQKNIENEF